MILLPSLVLGAPRGFDAPESTHQAPLGFNQNPNLNTVAGVRNNAQDGDYAILQGNLRLDDKGNLYLVDQSKDEIRVVPSNPIKLEGAALNTRAKCQMWGQIKKSFSDLYLQLHSFSCGR